MPKGSKSGAASRAKTQVPLPPKKGSKATTEAVSETSVNKFPVVDVKGQEDNVNNSSDQVENTLDVTLLVDLLPESTALRQEDKLNNWSGQVENALDATLLVDLLPESTALRQEDKLNNWSGQVENALDATLLVDLLPESTALRNYTTTNPGDGLNETLIFQPSSSFDTDTSSLIDDPSSEETAAKNNSPDLVRELVRTSTQMLGAVEGFGQDASDTLVRSDTVELSMPQPSEQPASSREDPSSSDAGDVGHLEHDPRPSRPLSPNRMSRKHVQDTVSTPKGRNDRTLFGSLSADFHRNKRPQHMSLLPLTGEAVAPFQKRPLTSSSLAKQNSVAASPVELLKKTSNESQSEDTDVESNQRRAQRLGMELNLATPAGWRKKNLSASPSPREVPVPKAWSTLILDTKSQQKPMTLELGPVVAPNSSGSSSRTGSRTDEQAHSRLMEEIKRQNEELLRSNERLEKENAKLKAAVVGSPGVSSAVMALTGGSSRGVPGSPLRKGEPLYGSKKFDTGYSLGHPDSEKIMQMETSATDDPHAAQAKALARQVFSVNALLKSLRESSQEDKSILTQAMRQAQESQRKLEMAERRIAELELEIANLKESSNG